MKAAVSWSGGKDSCLAYYKAVLKGFEVSHLLNFVSKDGACMSHGIDSKLIFAQSQAIGIPLIQKETTWEMYEQSFKDAVYGLKRTGIEAIIFGDLQTIPGHEDWINRVCCELSIIPIKPLWGYDPTHVLKEFIDDGFEAVVISAKVDLLGKEWLGHKINKDFVRKICREKPKVDPCGELGEYHTLVLDGPLFKSKIKLLESSKFLKNGYWLLNIPGYEILEKGGKNEENI